MKKAKISKKLLKLVGRTNAKFGLIKEGDRVLIGLSGGKDSLALTHILKEISSFAPFKFSIKAVTVNFNLGEDFSFLVNHCREYGIEHEIINVDGKDALKSIRKNSSICSFFSRIRRGALYSYAIKNGFNKIALGHHLDDAAESFFMNFIYNGALRTLPPIYTAYNGLKVIRPLIFARERQLIAFAKDNNFKVVSDEFCPSCLIGVKMPEKRMEAKKLLAELEKKNKKLFISLKSAFSNIHLNSFFIQDHSLTKNK